MRGSTERTPTLRRVARGDGELEVADYPGAEPAIVVMHGFPDRRSINEPLARHLVGRRVLLFDFLGYGGSDKPAGHVYDAASCEDDLDAVVSELADGPVVIVGHDASGPTAINWVQRNSERTAHLVLLNCYYHQTSLMRFPEIIALFADPATRALTAEIAADQGLMLLGLLWQGAAFDKSEAAQGACSSAGSAHGRRKPRLFAALPLRELLRFVGLSPRKMRIGVRLLRRMAKWKFVPSAEQVRWLEQFADRPSTKEAFLGWTGDLHHNVASNTARIDSLRSLACPVTVAFGTTDPYITPTVAEEIAALFPTSSLQFLEAGHWVQLELPERLAEIICAQTPTPHPPRSGPPTGPSSRNSTLRSIASKT